MTKPIKLGIIGGGWRTTFFLQIARELPEHFQVGGLLVRNAEKGQALEARWGVPVYLTLDELLRVSDLQFVVVSVSWSATPMFLKELASRNLPALAETPPAPDIEGLIALQPLLKAGAKIQVAEQYQFQPLHAARLAIAGSGKLGTITQAQISVAHGYHAMSLMRKFLGIRFDRATITAKSFISPLVAGSDRNGHLPMQEKIEPSKQVIASLDFGDQLGIYDFTYDQYFSWIRAPRMLIRGERGEINNTQIHYLENFQTPISLELQRQNAGENGNLEGYYLKGIQAGNGWLYQNPFVPGRLSDDEIAIASCLDHMARYVEGGPEFYGLEEAAQDHYLSIMIDQALTTGEPVRTSLQPWAQL
jgi:predicted dehydrogenase